MVGFSGFWDVSTVLPPLPKSKQERGNDALRASEDGCELHASCSSHYSHDSLRKWSQRHFFGWTLYAGPGSCVSCTVCYQCIRRLLWCLLQLYLPRSMCCVDGESCAEKMPFVDKNEKNRTRGLRLWGWSSLYSVASFAVTTHTCTCTCTNPCPSSCPSRRSQCVVFCS